jgi:nitroreductase
MAQDDLYTFIFKRKSIRKFHAEPLDEMALSDIRSFLGTITPMLPDIKIETRILDSSTVKGLSRTNAPHFLAFFSEPKDGYLVNAGFMLQQLDLYLSSKGIGSCYQGLAKVAKGIDSPAGLFIILISFGKPSEQIYRKSVAEFKREPVAKISTVKGMDDIIEAARLAPSGINNQPWFFTGGDGMIHSYCEKALIGDSMNRINMGIALCHLWVAARHLGKVPEFKWDEVGAENVPKGHYYISSVEMK